MRSITLILLVLALIALPAQAQLNFVFSENVSGGTISGEIEGLTLNATSTPTDIIIFSQPSGYAVGPTDLLSAGYSFYGSDNTFTVNSSGQITSANVGIYVALAGGGYQGYSFDVSEPFLGLSNANGIYEANNSAVITMGNSNSGGFGGVTYSAVPEPRQTMALILLAGICLMVGRMIYARRADKAFSLR